MVDRKIREDFEVKSQHRMEAQTRMENMVNRLVTSLQEVEAKAWEADQLQGEARSAPSKRRGAKSGGRHKHKNRRGNGSMAVWRQWTAAMKSATSAMRLEDTGQWRMGDTRNKEACRKLRHLRRIARKFTKYVQMGGKLKAAEWEDAVMDPGRILSGEQRNKIQEDLVEDAASPHHLLSSGVSISGDVIQK